MGALTPINSVHEPSLGYAVWRASACKAADDMCDWLTCGTRCKTVCFVNPHAHMAAMHDDDYLRALTEAAWVLPDGIGIVLGLRALGSAVHERIAGPDFFPLLSRRLDAAGGVRVCFIGSTPSVLERIARRYGTDFPRTIVSGYYAPRFQRAPDADFLDDCARHVAQARPDVVFLGMTAPKQELVAQHLQPRCCARLILGIGAAFDYYAGTKARAPAGFQALGLEWVYRLLAEPHRMWSRTFVSAPAFVADVATRLLR